MDQQMELDSHADTSVIGKESALLIHDLSVYMGTLRRLAVAPTVASSVHLLPMTTQRQGMCICL